MSNLVAFFRQQRGWSQETLAEKTGLSPRTIQRVESNGPIRPSTRLVLAKALEKPLEEVFPSEDQYFDAKVREVVRKINEIAQELVKHFHQNPRQATNLRGESLSMVRLQSGERITALLPALGIEWEVRIQPSWRVYRAHTSFKVKSLSPFGLEEVEILAGSLLHVFKEEYSPEEYKLTVVGNPKLKNLQILDLDLAFCEIVTDSEVLEKLN